MGTGCFDAQKLAGEDTVCHVCQSLFVEDEQYFLFECPLYAQTTGTIAALFQEQPHSVASLINNNDPTMYLGRYHRTCFLHKQVVLEHDSISMSALQC